jgi:hypothetical protein
MASRIFEKQDVLRPSAMATVAQRRFDDAEALRVTGKNAHANGTAYLVGFVIEILLKAQLVRKFQAIARKRLHQVAESEREIWRLIWQRHDLAAMLEHMNELEAALLKRGEIDGRDYLVELREICATWTIQARYSSRTMQMNEASKMLENVRVLKELLK